MIGSTIFYEKKKPPFSAKLTLVSLMDIFTILVFFLLLNSGESQRIENAKFVELPDSSSGVSPHTDLNILISDDEIFLGDKLVARVSEVFGTSERVIDALAEQLDAHAAQMGELSAFEKHAGLAVTISGDRSVPYALLKLVMTTCQQSNYRNISLAVNRVIGTDSNGVNPDEADSTLALHTSPSFDLSGEGN